MRCSDVPILGTSGVLHGTTLLAPNSRCQGWSLFDSFGRDK